MAGCIGNVMSPAMHNPLRFKMYCYHLAFNVRRQAQIIEKVWAIHGALFIAPWSILEMNSTGKGIDISKPWLTSWLWCCSCTQWWEVDCQFIVYPSLPTVFIGRLCWPQIIACLFSKIHFWRSLFSKVFSYILNAHKRWMNVTVR